MTLAGHAQPLTPAPPTKKPCAPSSHTRFTVRDGFHLKTRNAEAQAAIDRQLLPSDSSSRDVPPLESTERDSSKAQMYGPTKREVRDAAVPATTPSNNTDEQPPQLALDDSAPQQCAGGSSNAVAVLSQLREPEQTASNSRRVRSVLQAPSEWLIHRQRPNETPQRKQRKADKLLCEVLAAPSQPSTDAKTHETLKPTRPRFQSTLGSTYSQRVLAARRSPSHGRREQLAPITSTERSLLQSREANNKAVDRLLVSLFQQPSNAASDSATLSATMASRPTVKLSRFSTRRSVIRQETAVALRSRKLLSRMHELRSLPQLLVHMESLRQHTQQRRIQEHGTDLVAQNRTNVQLHVLQKPSQTPLLPSATDHKLHQAQQRKQELDAAQEERVRHAVDRWQTRRAQRVEQERRHHVQSQWLLLTTLAESAHKWLWRFQDFRARRKQLLRVTMAKRLQRYWRQQLLLRRSSPQQLLERASPLSTLFFRLPVVSQAVVRLQRCVRAWLERKQHTERSQAVALLVTAWLAFQDVKFRRIILRFRKRVRDFQAMWRSWRAITDARVKLMLLVWTKLERKVKRRGGVASGRAVTTPPAPRHTSQTAQSPTSTTGLTLIQVFQEAAAERLLLQQHKKLEGMHRHLRNGGMVQTPITARTPAPPSSSPTSGRTASRSRVVGNAHVRKDLELRHHMTDEFQLAMYDFYTTSQSLSDTKRKQPSPARVAVGGSQSPERQHSPSRARKSPSREPYTQQNLPLQLPSSSMAIPAPPAAEKVPFQLKVTLLRQLISDKRKQFSDARDRGREEWASKRKQMRNAALRYDVLDELAAFQQLQAKYATFLMLHSISEDELLQLIHKAQNQAASTVTSTVWSGTLHGPPSDVSNPNRKNSSVVTSSSLDTAESRHAVISIGASVLERFDDDE